VHRLVGQGAQDGLTDGAATHLVQAPAPGSAAAVLVVPVSARTVARMSATTVETAHGAPAGPLDREGEHGVATVAGAIVGAMSAGMGMDRVRSTAQVVAADGSLPHGCATSFGDGG